MASTGSASQPVSGEMSAGRAPRRRRLDAGEQHPGRRGRDLAGDQLAGRRCAGSLRRSAGRRCGSWPWRRCGPPPPPARRGAAGPGRGVACAGHQHHRARPRRAARRASGRTSPFVQTAPTVMRGTSGRWRASHSKGPGGAAASRSQANGIGSGVAPPSGAASTPGAEPGGEPPHRAARPPRRRSRPARSRRAGATAREGLGAAPPAPRAARGTARRPASRCPRPAGCPAASSRGRSGRRPEMCRLERGQSTTVAPDRRSARHVLVVEVHRVHHQRLRPEPGARRRHRRPGEGAERAGVEAEPEHELGEGAGAVGDERAAPRGPRRGGSRPARRRAARRRRPGGWSRRRAGSAPRAGPGPGSPARSRSPAAARMRLGRRSSVKP